MRVNLKFIMNKEREEISIHTSYERFFHEYLKLKKPIIEAILSIINKKDIKLADKLISVFALLLYLNYIYRDMDNKSKWEKVFDEESKEMIMSSLSIKKEHLNTYLSLMRKYKILVNKEINQYFVFYPDSNYEMTFKFNISNEK